MHCHRQRVEVLGSFFAGLSTGKCGLGTLSRGIAADATPDEWYPLETFDRAVGRITGLMGGEHLLQRLGSEMMKNWYDQGRGRDVVSTAVDYLKLQRGSRGYRICVRGPRQATGHFRLVDLDTAGGTARLQGRTVVPRPYERGVLLGGLGWAGDLLFFDVLEHPESAAFQVFFVNRENRNSLKWNRGKGLSEVQWRLANQQRRAREREIFWRWVGRALAHSPESLSPAEPAPAANEEESWTTAFDGLSRRETEVVAGVLNGRTLPELADELRIAYTSVLTYQRRAFVKLGVSTQKELFRLVRS